MVLPTFLAVALLALAAFAANPVFSVLDLRPVGTNNNWRVRWNSVPGTDYQLQRTSDDQLRSTNNLWVPVLSVRATDSVTAVDDLAGSGIRQRFYRVVQLTNDQSLVVSPVDPGTGAGGSSGNGTTLRIITGGTQTVSSVVFFDNGNLLGDGVPGFGNSWEFNLPPNPGGVPRIRRISARVTTVEGTVLDTQASAFLQADTARFVLVNDDGSRSYGRFISVDAAGGLGHFLYFPESLGDAARITGAHFDIAAGATLKNLVGSVGIEFASGRFFRGHTDNDPLVAAGGLRTLDLEGIGPVEVRAALGRPAGEPLAVLWNGLPLAWLDGAFADAGWSALKVRPPFGDLPLPLDLECATVTFDTKSGDPTLVLCFHGDWTPFGTSPAFRIPRAEPLKIYLGWNGTLAANGTLEATFADGATVRGSVSWREPNFEVRFQGRNIVIPALASLKRALPANPEQCIPSGNSVAELDAAAKCLTSFRDTYRALAMGGLAESSLDGGQAFAPLPEPTDSLGPALSAWAARLASWTADRSAQVLDDAMKADLRKVAENAARTGEAAADLPSVLKLLRGVVALRQHAGIAGGSELVPAFETAQERLFLAGERIANDRGDSDSPETFANAVEVLAASLDDVGGGAAGAAIVAAGGGSPQARLRALLSRIRDRRGITFLHRRLIAPGQFNGANNNVLRGMDSNALLDFLQECVDVMNALRKENLATSVLDLPAGAPPLREALHQVRPHFDAKHSLLAQEALRSGDYGRLRAAVLQRARYFALNASLGEPLRSDRAEFLPVTETLLRDFVEKFKARPRPTIASFCSGDMLAVETILDDTADNGSGSDIEWARSELQLCIQLLGISNGGSEDCDVLAKELLLRGFNLSQAPPGSEGQRQVRITGKYEEPTTKSQGPFQTMQLNLGGRFLSGRLQVHSPTAPPFRFLIRGMLIRESSGVAEFAFVRRDEIVGGAVDGPIRGSGTITARSVDGAVSVEVAETALFGSQAISRNSRFEKKADVAPVSPQLTALFTGQAHGDASEVIRAQELAPLHTLQIKQVRQRVLGTPATPGGPRTTSTLDLIQQYFDAENTLVARRVAAVNINSHLAGVLTLVSTEQVPLARQMLRELLSRSRVTAEGLTLNSWNWLRVIFSRHRADPQATVGSFRNFMGPEIDKTFAGNSFKYEVKLIDAGVSPDIDLGIFEIGLTGVKVEIQKSRTDGTGGTSTIRFEGGYGQLGIGWSPNALDFLGGAGGGTGGDEVTAFSNIDYSEQSLQGPIMILGASAGVGVGATSASVGPSALFMYGTRILPPLAFPLPFTSTGDNEFRVPSVEVTFASGYLFADSAIVDPQQFNLSTEPINQAFSAQGSAQGSVYFDVNQAVLRTCGWVGLRELVAEYRAIFENEGATISVLGFADATGSDTLNDDLSQRRADSVKAALVNVVGPGRGVPLDRIRSIGLGRKPALGQAPTRNAQLNDVERDFIALKRQELGTLQPNQPDQRWRSVSILLNNLIKVDLRTPGTQ